MTQLAPAAAQDIPAIVRDVLVTPGMCGPNPLFMARVGDWTWDTVGRLCGLDVCTARDVHGRPTYLAFTYIRVRSPGTLGPRTVTFGDRLNVTSACFSYGTRSVLTVHNICSSGDGAAATVADLADVHRTLPADQCVISCFNRWVGRSVPGDNTGLEHAPPASFRHEHLPLLDEQHSPRMAIQRAKALGTFTPPQTVPDFATVATHASTYVIDVSRDLNGVGLVYFASYLSIADLALWRLWRHLGRDEHHYLATTIIDQSTCILGNANPGASLLLRTGIRRSGRDQRREIVDVSIEEQDTGRAVAISTIHTTAQASR